jgi:hypothetical protein
VDIEQHVLAVGGLGKSCAGIGGAGAAEVIEPVIELSGGTSRASVKVRPVPRSAVK